MKDAGDPHDPFAKEYEDRKDCNNNVEICSTKLHQLKHILGDVDNETYN